MTYMNRSLVLLLSLVTLFFAGCSNKKNQVPEKYNALADELAFGNLSSNTAVYFFTDWLCPACQRFEPTMEKSLPQLFQNSRVTFVDVQVHHDSKHFLPYNLAFMLQDKANYIKSRQVIHGVATSDVEMTKENVKEAVHKALHKLKMPYHHVAKEKIKDVRDYYEALLETFDVHVTPTIVVQNRDTHKTVILAGLDDATEDKIQKAIAEVRN